MTRELSDWTDKVVDALTSAHVPEPKSNGTYVTCWHHRFYAMPGKTFDRVVKQSVLTPNNEPPTWDNQQRFVQCFVNRETGDIHYAAGWQGPAKWKSGPAVEWHAAEAADYADFVKRGHWGYQGQREAYEAALEQEVSS